MEILATAQGENQLILSPKSNYQAEQNPPKQCSGNQAKANSHLRSVYVCKTTELRARRVGEWGTLAWGRSRASLLPLHVPTLYSVHMEAVPGRGQLRGLAAAASLGRQEAHSIWSRRHPGFGVVAVTTQRPSLHG